MRLALILKLVSGAKSGVQNPAINLAETHEKTLTEERDTFYQLSDKRSARQRRGLVLI